jgi:tetratricopeptide (TPR) repeat protein
VLTTVPAAADVDAPALNAYARARLADGDGALGIAVLNYKEALGDDPANPVVAFRSYRQAVQGGDMVLALKSARVLDAAGVLPKDGTILLTVDALLRKDWAAARILSTRIESQENFAFLTPILNSWISTANGTYAPPLSVSDKKFASLTSRYMDEHLALQALSRGDVDAAIPAIDRALSLRTNPLIGLRIVFAARLAQLGRKDKALECLAFDLPMLVRARESIEKGTRLPADPLTPAQGFARLLSRLGDDVSTADARPVALILARFATFADPASAELRLDLARQLLAQDHPDLALQEADRISSKGLYALAAEGLRVDALVADEKKDAALALARQLVARPDTGAAEQLRLGNILADDKDFAGAVDAYRAARGYYADGVVPWTLYLLEGSALERGGRWDEARVALEKAAALAPDEPVVLNYLGYAQVQRKQNMKQALALIEKASALKPDDASITDSLGWARYMAGDASAAVPVLEKAAEAAPDDMTINEHLGDALWVVGRRYEARYAWSAANVVADGSDAQRIESKMREGLRPEYAAP